MMPKHLSSSDHMNLEFPPKQHKLRLRIPRRCPQEGSDTRKLRHHRLLETPETSFRPDQPLELRTTCTSKSNVEPRWPNSSGSNHLLTRAPHWPPRVLFTHHRSTLTHAAAHTSTCPGHRRGAHQPEPRVADTPSPSPLLDQSTNEPSWTGVAQSSPPSNSSVGCCPAIPLPSDYHASAPHVVVELVTIRFVLPER